MPRLNLYEQQTSASGPRASGADFGAAPAQAMGETANQLFQIGNRIQEREDLSDRQRLRESFEEAAVPMLNDFDKRRDISSKESIPQFRDALTQKRQELISKHVGSPDSRSKLENQLDNLVSQYTKSAIGAKIKADQELMVRTLNQQFDKSALDTNAAPDVWSFSKDENLMLVEEMRPAMSPDQYMAAKRLAYAKPLQSAVKSHLAQGNWESAEAIMRDENFSKFLTAEEAIPLRIDVAVGRGKQDAETKRQDANVARFTMRKGEPLTPEETLRARSLPAKKDMTPADEITELELVQRKPATQDQVDKIFKTYVEGGKSDTMFGNSLQGRALSYVTENAVAYSNGFLTPDKARQFEASFNEAYGTKTYMDPVTGQPKPVTPSVPRFIQDAMSRGSGIYGGMASGATAPGSTPRPGETIQLDINGQTMGQAVVDASGRWSMPAPPESSASPAPAGGAPAVTIWEMADDIAGPAPAVAAALGSTPVIGSAFDGGGKTAENRQYVRTQISQMIDALSINPRNPVALVEMIRKEINVDPKVMDDPSAYRRRIEGVTRALTERLMEENQAGKNPDLPVKTRQDALEVANTIGNFLQKLMPPVAKNADEFMKLNLKSGDKYIDGKGDLYQVP
jgi:hypothetical protein